MPAWILAALVVLLINPWMLALVFPPGLDPHPHLVLASTVSSAVTGLVGIVLLVFGASVSWGRVAYGGFLLGSVAVGLELVFFVALHRPASMVGEILRPAARELYVARRYVINGEAACTAYHPRLGYTLRPGQCQFANIEFDTVVDVNSSGLRDDEASLLAPRVIALGDSVTMGWGVAVEETMPSRIEKATGDRVLNAGISSYGTARARMLLEDLDTSALEFLIVQYCGNDWRENDTYLRSGMSLAVSSEADFRARLGKYRSRYLPGAYVGTLVRNRVVAISRWLDIRSGIASAEAASREHAAAFVAIVREMARAVEGARILAFNGCAEPQGFVAAVSAELEQFPELPVSVIDIQFSDGELHLLDEHPNARGHEKLAVAILAEGLKVER